MTGCLTGKDQLRKKFAQSFFLAPQAKGYFVLNDVFRYIDETEPSETNSVAIEKVDDSGAAQPPAETGSSYLRLLSPLLFSFYWFSSKLLIIAFSVHRSPCL